jgi:hypothetical protein
VIRLVCIVEVEDAAELVDAELALDAFRESVQPSAEYGIRIYRATEADADAAHYAIASPDRDEDQS